MTEATLAEKFENYFLRGCGAFSQHDAAQVLAVLRTAQSAVSEESKMDAAQQFLRWNRSAVEPMVRVGFELAVFNAALQATRQPVQGEQVALRVCDNLFVYGSEEATKALQDDLLRAESIRSTRHPAGMAMVPVEPTRKMVARALDVACAYPGTHMNWKPMAEGIKAAIQEAQAVPRDTPVSGE